MISLVLLSIAAAVAEVADVVNSTRIVPRRDNIVSVLCMSMNVFTHEYGPPVCEFPFDVLSNDGARLSSSDLVETPARSAHQFVTNDAFANEHSMATLSTTDVKIDRSGSYQGITASGKYSKFVSNYFQFATSKSTQVVVVKMNVVTHQVHLNGLPTLAPALVTEILELAASLQHKRDPNATMFDSSKNSTVVDQDIANFATAKRNAIINKYNGGFYVVSAKGGGSLSHIAVVDRRQTSSFTRTEVAQAVSASIQANMFSGSISFSSSRATNTSQDVTRAITQISIARRGGASTPQTPADVFVWESELLENPDVISVFISNIFDTLTPAQLRYVLKNRAVHEVRAFLMAGVEQLLVENNVKDGQECLVGGTLWSLEHGCEQANVTANPPTGTPPLSGFNGTLFASRYECYNDGRDCYYHEPRTCAGNATLHYIRKVAYTANYRPAHKLLWYCVEPVPKYVFGGCFAANSGRECGPEMAVRTTEGITCCAALYDRQSVVQRRDAIVFAGLFSATYSNPFASNQSSCPRGASRLLVTDANSESLYYCTVLNAQEVADDSVHRSNVSYVPLPVSYASATAEVGGAIVDLTSSVPIYQQVEDDNRCAGFFACSVSPAPPASTTTTSMTDVKALPNAIVSNPEGVRNESSGVSDTIFFAHPILIGLVLAVVGVLVIAALVAVVICVCYGTKMHIVRSHPHHVRSAPSSQDDINVDTELQRQGNSGENDSQSETD